MLASAPVYCLYAYVCNIPVYLNHGAQSTHDVFLTTVVLHSMHSVCIIHHNVLKIGGYFLLRFNTDLKWPLVLERQRNKELFLSNFFMLRVRNYG